MRIDLPSEIKHIIDTLAGRGHEAFAVGGCVRDSLLKREPKDWDICTSARPEQVAGCFDRVVNTGLKYGTVTVVLNGKPFEVTAYRADGGYSDNRRPDTVTFGTDLKGDLARRDFTVNAMAYSPETGIADFFGGMDDLAAKIIRCVGDPGVRFGEDALRIMRALRFASVLGFTIESETARAVSDRAELLKNISAERIAGELNGIITGNGAESVLLEYGAVFERVIPGYAARGVSKVSPLAAPRLAVLLNGAGEAGARDILTRLRFDGGTVEDTALLIRHTGAEIPAEAGIVKRWLNILGEERFRLLAEVREAVGGEDKKALTAAADEIIGGGQCCSLKALAVSGADLIENGIPEGPAVGAELNRLLEMVMDGAIENDRDKLIKAVYYPR